MSDRRCRMVRPARSTLTLRSKGKGEVVTKPVRKSSALMAVIGVLVIAAGCADGIDGKEERPRPRNAGSEWPANIAPKQIVIDNFTFDPPTLTVSIGTKVTWVNRDDVPHTATSTAKPKRFDSGTLDTDDQFSHVFTSPGSYPYFCAVHPKMTGLVIVK
jgi:plastocyanin